MAPLLEAPGCWKVAVTPVGNPGALRVTSPVVPWRTRVTLTVTAGCPGKTTTEELGESDSDNLPGGLEFPPPVPQAASQNREQQARTEVRIRIGWTSPTGKYSSRRTQVP